MRQLLSYQEYEFYKTGLISGEETPDEFLANQTLALSIINTAIIVPGLVPQSKYWLEHLKEPYKSTFIQALIAEIDFLEYNTNTLYENPLQQLTSSSAGTASQGPLHIQALEAYQKTLCPKAKSLLYSIGWTYSGLDSGYDPCEYYQKELIEGESEPEFTFKDIGQSWSAEYSFDKSVTWKLEGKNVRTNWTLETKKGRKTVVRFTTTEANNAGMYGINLCAYNSYGDVLATKPILLTAYQGE